MTYGSPTTRMPASFARCKQPVKPTTHCWDLQILAHAAFVPGWVGRRDDAADRIRAARTYARRGPASAEFLAWLDAVEAECETISGHTREALRLVQHAEETLAAGSQYASPDWFKLLPPR